MSRRTVLILGLVAALGYTLNIVSTMRMNSYFKRLYENANPPQMDYAQHLSILWAIPYVIRVQREHVLTGTGKQDDWFLALGFTDVRISSVEM